MEKLKNAELPLVTLKNLTHVGTLSETDVKKHSLEGAGLSVSQHPDEWRSVARLKGSVWMFNQKDNRFLDFHELTSDQLTRIVEYGLNEGYVAYENRFAYSWYDDEAEQEFSRLFISLPALLEEYPDAEEEYEESVELVATNTFPDFTVSEGDNYILDKLVTVWVNLECPELDGAWWGDNFIPTLYSLPRGAVSAKKIEEWIASAVIQEAF